MALALKPSIQDKGALGTARRVTQIMRVLGRHKILGALRGKNHWPAPAELRKAFEELGVVFLKFGQVLALRRDLLTEPYIRELEHLHDQLPPVPFSTVRATVESGLGRPLNKLFRRFDKEPLATATIAQVHEAKTMDGRHVVVKVRRPGLEAVIADDIATLHYLAVLLESLFPKMVDLGLTSMVREFERSLRLEIDFKREARNIGRFRNAWAEIPKVWIPQVIQRCSSDAVLTMKYSPGVRIDVYAKRHPGKIRRQISTLLDLTLRSIFENGIFHADPHPGNVFVLPSGKLCLIDFGMIGELDESMRESLKFLLDAVVHDDSAAAADSFIEMAESSEHADRPELKVKIRAILQDMRGRGLEELSFGNTLAAMLRAGSQSGVRSSVAFFLLTRVFLILESEMRRLDPDFDFMGAFRRELKRLEARHFTFSRIKREAGRAARELERFVHDAPGNARRILRAVADGSLGNVRAPELESLAARINRDIQQLSVAVAAAALTVGGSNLAATPMQGWRSVVGEITFFCGLLIIFSIGLRSVRRFLVRRFAAWGPRPDKIEPPGM